MVSIVNKTGSTSIQRLSSLTFISGLAEQAIIQYHRKKNCCPSLMNEEHKEWRNYVLEPLGLCKLLVPLRVLGFVLSTKIQKIPHFFTS